MKPPGSLGRFCLQNTKRITQFWKVYLLYSGNDLQSIDITATTNALKSVGI